jgi:hypothetical protein
MLAVSEAILLANNKAYKELPTGCRGPNFSYSQYLYSRQRIYIIPTN